MSYSIHCDSVSGCTRTSKDPHEENWIRVHIPADEEFLDFCSPMCLSGWAISLELRCGK